MIIRCPSQSGIKTGAVWGALRGIWRPREIELQALPVELQDRPDLEVNAEPFGLEETIQYARLRRAEMCRLHGDESDLDISIESGAINGADVAVVVLFPAGADEIVVTSRPVPFPEGVLEAAQARGFKTTTAGDIIHERNPEIPANDWQGRFPPHISRIDQIAEAVARGLKLVDQLN